MRRSQASSSALPLSALWRGARSWVSSSSKAPTLRGGTWWVRAQEGKGDGGRGEQGKR